MDRRHRTVIGWTCALLAAETWGGIQVDPSNAQVRAVIGSIVAVEFEEKTFTVKNEKGESFHLRYDAKTQFMEQGKTSTAQAVLKVGRRIIATCEGHLAKIVKPMELPRDEPAPMGAGGR